jgi:formate dehydrogenase subunit gamma
MTPTVVGEGQLLRHSSYTRVVHWSVAIFFVLSLLSGLAIYTPWLFAWISPVFGGGALTRQLHPWFSLAFVACFALQFIHWLEPMRWQKADRVWLRNIRAYVTNAEVTNAEATGAGDVGFFNAGQKGFFWTVAVSSVVFTLTGLALWFPQGAGRPMTAVSYVLHGAAMLVMLAAFVVHVYMSTAQQPGTFRSMTRGTVSKRWAWTHHPSWYRDETREARRVD